MQTIELKLNLANNYAFCGFLGSHVPNLDYKLVFLCSDRVIGGNLEY